MTLRRTTRAADPVTDAPAAQPVPPRIRRGRRRFAELAGSWRAALRIARRESRRARRRTALVLAMIALPVLVLAFLAASYDMAELTAQEKIDRRLGVADAELRWFADTPIDQDEWGESWYPRNGDVEASSHPATAAEVSALLGPGSRFTEIRGRMPLTVQGPEGDETFEARVLDLTDPLARGLVRFRSGRAPREPAEVAVSPAALRRLDVRLGAVLATADGMRAYTVVGVVEFPDDLGPAVALHPSAVPRNEPLLDSSWLVDVPGGVDAAMVARLNDNGVGGGAPPPPRPGGGAPPRGGGGGPAPYKPQNTPGGFGGPRG
ncbi:hypothetical protein ACFWDS_11655, partial [Micromonospora profundi]